MSLRRVNVEIAKYLVYILSIAAFALLFFTPFGPIDEKFVPYHPIGWAGIFTYFAMILSFNRRFEETKDNFWLIVTAGFFPLLISDLYFFPIPTFLGFGILEWAGLQFIVFSLGFIYYSQDRILKYSNLAILMLFPLVAVAFLFEGNAFLSPLKTLFLLVLVVAAFSLSYCAYQQGDYLFIVGTGLNFMVANTIVALYLITGRIIFDWEHLLMAVVTDRLAILGRVLMGLSGHLASANNVYNSGAGTFNATFLWCAMKAQIERLLVLGREGGVADETAVSNDRCLDLCERDSDHCALRDVREAKRRRHPSLVRWKHSLRACCCPD